MDDQMKKSILLLLVFSILFTGCSQSTDTGQVLTIAPIESPVPENEQCPDVSGIWLGIQGTGSNQFDTGYIFEQEGCNVTGIEALYRDYGFSTELACEYQNEELICNYNSTLDDCDFKLDVMVFVDHMEGTYSTCMLQSSAISMDRVGEAQLAAFDLKMENISYAPTQRSCDIARIIKPDWDMEFCDAFDENYNNWQLGTSSNNLAEINIQIEDGKLKLVLPEKQPAVIKMGCCNGCRHLKVLKKTIWFRQPERLIPILKEAVGGIAFEGKYFASAESFYVFIISNSGTYTLQELVNNQFTPIISPRENSAIKNGENNTISISKEDGHYEFYINGELVSTQDLSPLDGGDMMIAAYVNEGVVANYEIDDLLVLRGPVDYVAGEE